MGKECYHILNEGGFEKDGQNSQRKWMAPPKESGYTIEGSVAEDFLGGPVAKTLRSHCRGHRFSLWSGS